VFFLTRPGPKAIERLLERSRGLGFNYREVGATALGRPLPEDYVIDRYGARLGSGGRTFASAKRAIEHFVMYPAPWTQVIAPDGVASGAVFGTLVRHLGFWSLNPCRIIDVVDERSQQGARFGFAFGTLRGHAERGEERFEVVWRAQSDSVRYEVVAFSRPSELLARLGAPIARRYQLRFQRESCEQLRAAVDFAAAPG
jgi:uncharacterized protein (UPF0548 family)